MTPYLSGCPCLRPRDCPPRFCTRSYVAGVRRPSGASCPPSPRPAPAGGSRTTPGIWVTRVGPGQRGHCRMALRDPASCLGGPGLHNTPLFRGRSKELPQDVEVQAGGASYFGCRVKAWVCWL